MMKTMELYRDGEKVLQHTFKEMQQFQATYKVWMSNIKQLKSKHDFYVIIKDAGLPERIQRKK